jgi:hypothetical protein
MVLSAHASVRQSVLTSELDSPGRFFAAVEMKMILAYILLTYDVKLDNANGRPLNYWLGVHVFPNPSILVSFRKRAS